MKAQELRIGNLYDNNGNYFVVTPSTIESVFESERVWCKPIPLTEEWLLKFGFEKNITTDLYPTFSYDILNVNDGIVYVLNYGFVNHIKYVHQLQNLYFTLTREELKLK
jgi:hypothetical protein